MVNKSLQILGGLVLVLFALLGLCRFTNWLLATRSVRVIQIPVYDLVPTRVPSLEDGLELDLADGDRTLWSGTCVEDGQMAGANPVSCSIDMDLFRRELVPAEYIGSVLDGWVNPGPRHEVVEYQTPFFRTCRDFEWVDAGEPPMGTMVEVWVHIGYPEPIEVLREGGDVLGWCAYCGNPRVLLPAANMPEPTATPAPLTPTSRPKATETSPDGCAYRLPDGSLPAGCGYDE